MDNIVQYEQSIKDKLKQKRNVTGVDYNILLKKFFIDEFLRVLSKSEYSSSFVWKGGFVLSAITGIQTRTTVDIDTMLSGVTVNIESLTNIMQDITGTNNQNYIKYRLVGIESIQEEKEYAGLRIKIESQLGNINEEFHLDVATGEKLIPSEIEWEYKPIIGNDTIKIMIYRPERILAEKLQTLLERGLLNTRMKDFYDIYIIPKFAPIDFNILLEAFSVVMKERGSLNQWNRRDRLLLMIKNDKVMNDLWRRYAKSHSFVKEVSYEDTLDSAKGLFDKIEDF